MKKTALATGLSLFVAGLCNAGTYQAEIIPVYATGEVEVAGIDVDTDLLTLGGNFYIGSVNDSKGPLAEAPFMDRASSLTVAYLTGEIESSGNEADIDGYALGGRYVDRASGWILEAGFDTLEQDDSDDTDTLNLSVGRYIAKYTTLTFTYTNVDDSSDDDSDAYALSIKRVTPMAMGAFISLTGSVGVADVDSSDNPLSVGGSVTYYPTRHFGFGASAAFVDSDDTEERAYSLFGSWFPVNNLAITGSYNIIDDDEIDVEADIFTLGASYRF